MGWFSKLKDGLGKTRKKVEKSLTSLLGRTSVDEKSLQEVEDALIGADLGPAVAAQLAERIRKHKFEGEITSEALASALSDGLAKMLDPVAKPLEPKKGNKPHIVLLVGVNGSGKTTTAAKLANRWQRAGKKVVLVAGDTFRAAAIEQLEIWGKRCGAEVVSGEMGGDAAALSYKAVERARAGGADVVIIDTAGRLHNRTELMDELAKIVRVVRKFDEKAPHDTVIVLDGTSGQNAMNQVAAFKEVAGISGLIVTKLDGTAKGGVVVALADRFKLPVHAVGVGEGADDLQSFTARDFANALAGVDSGKG